MIVIRSSLIVLLLVLSSCANVSKFESTPVAEKDFNKPLNEIRKDFSDVELFESRWRGIPTTLGSLGSLESQWGKADEVEVEWGNRVISALFGAGLTFIGFVPVGAFIIIEGMFLYPAETHHWNKENTHIEVEISRQLTWSDDKEVTLWEWEKTGDSQVVQYSLVNE